MAPRLKLRAASRKVGGSQAMPGDPGCNMLPVRPPKLRTPSLLTSLVRNSVLHGMLKVRMENALFWMP